MTDLITTNGTKKMTSLEISELVEKRHDNVKRTVEMLADRAVIEFPQSEEIKTATKPTTIYLLDKRSSLVVVAQLSPEFTARVVDRWQELEAQAAANTFRLPATYSEALRALADETERRELAERTKAEIGHRREATAMNTASQLSKKNRKLEEQLDHLKEYVTIKRMSMIFHGQQFNWRELKSASSLMELPAIDVFDANYGFVKAYHVNVWREVYAISPDGSTCRMPDEPENRADVN